MALEKSDLALPKGAFGSCIPSGDANPQISGCWQHLREWERFTPHLCSVVLIEIHLGGFPKAAQTPQAASESGPAGSAPSSHPLPQGMM